MKQVITAFLLLILCFNCQAGQLNKNEKDSLSQIWNDATQVDTNRLLAMRMIANSYGDFSRDSVYFYYNKLLKYAIKTNSLSFQADAYNYMAVYYMEENHFDKSKTYFDKALHICKSINYKKGLGAYYYNIGTLYQREGNAPRAINNYLMSLDYLQLEIYRISIYRTIGIIYKGINEDLKAIEYYNKSLSLSQKLNDHNGMSKTFSEVASIYINRKDFEKSRAYLNKALTLSSKLNIKTKAKIYSGLGSLYDNTKEYTKAIEYYNKALNIGEKIKDNTLISNVSACLAFIFLKQDKIPKAMDYALSSYKIANKIDLPGPIQKSSRVLYLLYEIKGKPSKALEMYEIYIKMRDSLVNVKNTNALLQEEYRYEYELQALSDSVKNAELNKVRDAKLFVQESRLNQERLLRIGLGLGLFLVLAISSLIFYRLRDTQQKKLVIESQNKKINDSINYAKKIQDTLLPPTEIISKNMVDLFIYHKPKEKVSGDFYWFKGINEHICIIACVDCIGQGVLGGFMSTMGSVLLDKLTEHEGIGTSEILRGLNNEIIKLLQQNESGQIQDGIGISVCKIDLKRNKIEYSGARNGIVIINERKAVRYRADLFPVGGNYAKSGVQIKRNYKTQIIDIKKNDKIFMYTNGFMEQLGGENKRPMKYKAFEKCLLGLAELQSNDKRSAYLNSKYNEWRGENERNDDVLVVGFQLI